MVRLGGLEMLAGMSPMEIWRVASPLLSDPSRGRANKDRALLAPSPRQANRRPIAMRSLKPLQSSWPRSVKMQIGRSYAQRSPNFLARRGSTAEAESEYRAALRLNPQFTPAATNLADLFRTLGNEIPTASKFCATPSSSLQKMRRFTTRLDLL